MLDVHPPNEPVRGWRDFFVHLTTITIGLLIALSMEGCVEWQHHRHLVRDADASLRMEIRNNSRSMAENLEGVRNEEKVLTQDLAILEKIIANPKVPNYEYLQVKFKIRGFDDVSWKTAQSTGAFSYMPYAQAQEYSDIYDQQHEIDDAEAQAVRDTVVSVAPIFNLGKGDRNPGAAEAMAIKTNIQILQVQLTLIDGLMQTLDTDYTKFLKTHPE